MKTDGQDWGLIYCVIDFDFAAAGDLNVGWGVLVEKAIKGIEEVGFQCTCQIGSLEVVDAAFADRGGAEDFG